VDAYFNRGAGPAKLETNDYAGAISDFDECIKLDDTVSGAYFNRGLVKVLKEDYDGAIADYDECIKLDDKDSNAYCNRGMATFERKYYDGPLKRRPV
jgi:tetratricopeptide (TPR) repeat protein